MNSSSIFKISFLFLNLVFLIFSCKNQEDEKALSLQDYIEENSTLTPFNELVACAAGGQVGFLEDIDFPLNMFFYPELNASDFKYYETENENADPNDLNIFLEKEANDIDVFNGFLKRFPLPLPEKDVWARVSFIANDTLWYCKPVRIKYNSKPSEFAPQLCEVILDNPLEPAFEWQDGQADDNVIYFQVISDEDGNALSGTYTEELNFQYYNLVIIG